jgi:hypothetical protein
VPLPMTSGGLRHSSSATAPGALFSVKRPIDSSGQTPDLDAALETAAAQH